MLGEATVVATVAVKDLDKAKQFYSGTLGLALVGEMPGGVTYQAGDSQLFVYPSPEVAGTNKATYAAFNVTDVAKVVADLQAKGVQFDTFEIPGGSWDGVIASMGNSKGAWFKDPDGNIFNVIQM